MKLLNNMKQLINKVSFSLIQSLLVCIFVFLIELAASFFIKDLVQSMQTFGVIFLLLTGFFFFFSKGSTPELIMKEDKDNVLDI